MCIEKNILYIGFNTIHGSGPWNITPTDKGGLLYFKRSLSNMKVFGSQKANVRVATTLAGQEN